jgi:hypothetical protein
LQSLANFGDKEGLLLQFTSSAQFGKVENHFNWAGPKEQYQPMGQTDLGRLQTGARPTGQPLHGASAHKEHVPHSGRSLPWHHIAGGDAVSLW